MLSSTILANTTALDRFATATARILQVTALQESGTINPHLQVAPDADLNDETRLSRSAPGRTST
jgi:hypothetical protein